MKLLVALALAVHVSSSAADDCAPLADDAAEWDCAQFSKMCKLFDKTLCKVKNKGFIMTEAGCLAEGGDFVEVKWCPEQDLREKCNCQKGEKKKCIVRKESNGKILTRDQDSPACESTEADDALDSNLFNCPNYEFLLNFYLERTVG